MKIILFTVAMAAMMLAECGSPRNAEHSHDADSTHQHTQDTHTHDDGSVHENHADSTDHHQEEFKVEGDSSAVKKDQEHGHSHDDGSHSH